MTPAEVVADRPADEPRADPDQVFRAFRQPWRLGVAALGSVVVGAALGLALTALTAQPDSAIGASRIGPWLYWPSSGTPDSNPYVRARLALTGQIPAAAAEGEILVARTDDDGHVLRRACDYRVEEPVPQTLFWSIQAADRDGGIIPNPAERTAFTSTTVLRDGAGRFAIDVSREARPGNWLPLSGTGDFILVLRLYGFSVPAGSGRDQRDILLPRIVQRGCAP